MKILMKLTLILGFLIESRWSLLELDIIKLVNQFYVNT